MSAPAEASEMEQRLREILRANPYFGDWAEWSPLAYDRIPVLPRMAMSHLYGRHDDTEIPYQYCVLCTLFRVPANTGTAP